MELLNKEGSASQAAREFTGEFFFTNPDTEDFTGIWNGTPYHFPAMKTSKFYIVDANPLETQEIRKRFATRLAERMFGKTSKYRELEKKSEGKITPQFYDYGKEITPFVNQCLKPLPKGEIKIGKKQEEKFEMKRDPKTKKQVVRVYGEDDNGSVSLVGEAENLTE